MMAVFYTHVSCYYICSTHEASGSFQGGSYVPLTIYSHPAFEPRLLWRYFMVIWDLAFRIIAIKYQLNVLHDVTMLLCGCGNMLQGFLMMATKSCQKRTQRACVRSVLRKGCSPRCRGFGFQAALDMTGNQICCVK